MFSRAFVFVVNLSDDLYSMVLLSSSDRGRHQPNNAWVE